MGTSFQGGSHHSFFGLNSILSLLFPHKCVSCDDEVGHKDKLFCFGCESRINWSRPYDKEINDQILQGINLSNIERAHSLFVFSKEGVEQSVIHRLKYQNSKQTGVLLGKKLGLKIKETKREVQLDCLIAVPVFHSKKYDRGYNQSQSISKGLSLVLNIPIENSILRKKRKTKTQTKLSKEERQINVENSFTASKKFLKFKSIGIVDDVVTTGSTLRSICREITGINKSIKITIFTIGVARLE